MTKILKSAYYVTKHNKSNAKYFLFLTPGSQCFSCMLYLFCCLQFTRIIRICSQISKCFNFLFALPFSNTHFNIIIILNKHRFFKTIINCLDFLFTYLFNLLYYICKFSHLPRKIRAFCNISLRLTKWTFPSKWEIVSRLVLPFRFIKQFYFIYFENHCEMKAYVGSKIIGRFYTESFINDYAYKHTNSWL